MGWGESVDWVIVDWAVVGWVDGLDGLSGWVGMSRWIGWGE